MDWRTRRWLQKAGWALAIIAGSVSLCAVALYGLALFALSVSGAPSFEQGAGGDLQITRSDPIVVTADYDGAARVYRGERLVGVIRGHAAPLIRAVVVNKGDDIFTIDARGESRVTHLASAERYHHADIAAAIQRAYDRLWEPYGRKSAEWVLSVVDQVLPLSIPEHRRGGRGDVFKDCDDCPELVEIRSGSFLMGSPFLEADRGPEEGRHLVTISRPFALGRFEVTFDEWDACVAGGGCNSYEPDRAWGGGRRPVINVSWEDAQSYVAWLKKETNFEYYLPSEEEWEYAARAGTTSPYPWGNLAGEDHANCNGCRPGPDGTTPVGSFAANPFGLYDMHGNVSEWVETCYHTSDKQPDCSEHVLRGGSWRDKPDGTRSAARHHDSARSNSIGFRVARKLEIIPTLQAVAAPSQPTNDANSLAGASAR